jgi:hypothetical protein
MILFTPAFILQSLNKVLLMSRKSSSHVSDKSEEVVRFLLTKEDIHVQIEKAIKAIPVLADKLQIIAINGYM